MEWKMNFMNPWSWMVKSPLSGDVDQEFVSSFFSPKVNFNLAGDAGIEKEVVQSVASYGKQLGLITEVLLELTTDSSSESVEKLKAINEQVTAVKERNRVNDVATIESMLEGLPDEERSTLLASLVKKYGQ
jgi:hypothetical protein